jgi:predicted nucleotide-binding protein (sugar kinase/HSP70/actin superfamily)
VDVDVTSSKQMKGAKIMDNFGYYGYGTRRKRNIQFQREETSAGIDWGNNEELEEGMEEEEGEEAEQSEEIDTSLEDYEDLNQEQPYLNGKPFKMKSKPVKQPFTETHVRITTYLENNVHQIIRMLQKQGQIESITKFINDSVKEYLMNHYQDEN